MFVLKVHTRAQAERKREREREREREAKTERQTETERENECSFLIDEQQKSGIYSKLCKVFERFSAFVISSFSS